MRKRTLLLAVGLGLAAVLPLLDHADQATCCTATSSLASTVSGPTAGDEDFFSVPSGPSNVMFLLDTSGSMHQLPQCGDYEWDQDGAPSTCRSPSFTLANPTTSQVYTVTGTCTPHKSGFTSDTSSLAWMEAVKPQVAYPDPGRTNALLWDCPPWGNGGEGCGTRVCSGDGCLFDPGAYYRYSDWRSSGNEANSLWPYARRRQLDSVKAPGTTDLPAAPCVALDARGNVITDGRGTPIDLGDACRTCMESRGFYIYHLKYREWWGVWSVTAPLFKGTFLNANPPKFVTARQVLKANAWLDPTHPLPQDQIRLGLATSDSRARSPRKARLIVPLGPDKAQAYPATQVAFRQARQYLLSVLNYDTTKYEDASGVICDGSTGSGRWESGFQDGFFNPADGATPLATALFNVGEYFTGGDPDKSLYGTLFGSGFTTTEFVETSAGRTSAAWVTKSQRSICWACQASSVILITDGSPNSEIDLPTSPTNLREYDDTGYEAVCGGTYEAGASVPADDTTFQCRSPSDGNATGLPRVADWLHTLAASGKLAPAGLRYDLALTGGQEAFRISTIGINLTDPQAKNILQATATLGHGRYDNASDPKTLADAVASAVNLVAPRQISFGAASTSALQAVRTTSAQAFLTRFRPTSHQAWEGHVYEAFLFSEFLNGCRPEGPTQPTVSCGQATVKNVSADLDGDGQCTGVFLIDLDCDRIVEDAATGSFLKLGTGTSANLPWDAGQVLSYETFPSPGPPAPGRNPGYRSADDTAANARTIFTWLGGDRVELTRANAGTLLPYLNVSAAWCDAFLSRRGISGGDNAPLECARQIIHYVRGWDVLDQDGDGCAGPGQKNAATCQRGEKGEERDRPMDAAYASSTGTPTLWKLGDVVHSSPAVLRAPIDPLRCDTGYEPQCTWAIRSPPGIPGQTPMDPRCTKGDCYRDYREAHLARPRVLLVGANDGMLHAFHAGSPLAAKDVFGSHKYDNGTGAELWAFVPPDMLPRLKDLLSAHQYMVDGSVMLRDVWVDGTGATDGRNTPAAPSGADGKKQASEFHTVAVFGRRAGGNQYTALDVTDPSAPTLLWSFPRTGSDDARYMAQSWTDFAPRPPPIVPVTLAPTEASPESDRWRGFSERWVVMFGGGYDPALTRGRAVFMLDVWTGATLWRFTDDDFKTDVVSRGEAAPSMFPVAGGVGPLDIGVASRQTLDVDGFFDTATWGDLGGNVFVARFHDPGVIGTSGRVENWFAARAFEQLRRTDDAQHVRHESGAGRNEFFHMTANAWESTTRTLRTYLGSGNREQLMQSSTQRCGTDSLLGCCQAGCTSVTATTVEDDGACSHSDTFSCVDGLLTHASSNSCPAEGTTCAASPGNLYKRDVSLSWTCPGVGTRTASGRASFDGSGLGSVAPVAKISTTSASFRAPTHNRFYGFISYGGAAPTRRFHDPASARVFDAHRLTDVPYPGSCSGRSCTLVDTTSARVTYDTTSLAVASTNCGVGVKSCAATTTDPGWFYEYGDVCPLQSCAASPPPWVDEKTGAGATVVLGCVFWPGFRPAGGGGANTDPCAGAPGRPTVHDYGVNYVTGTPTYHCSGFATGGRAYIASARSVTGAPGGAAGHVEINEYGEIEYGVPHHDSGGASGSHSAGKRSVTGTSIYWLEVPRQLHDCRHVSSDTCN